MTVPRMDDCGCCAGIAVMTPVTVENRPGLQAIAYRVGTHATFKHSMLARLATHDPPALAELRTREDDDFTIALLDAWALTADVLTFYQERIATESYLRTATEQLSVRELARLIGYQPAPGVAAQTYLAFKLDTTEGAPKSVSLDPLDHKIKVQSVPGPDEKPQTFETVETVELHGEWNDLRPRLTQAQDISATNLNVVDLYLEGTSTGLQSGDAILIVGDERKAGPSPRWSVRFLLTVTPDSKHDRTYVTWVDPLNPAKIPASGVTVFALGQRVALFGHNAPDPRIVNAPATLATGGDWIGFDPPPDRIELDAVYPRIGPGSWLFLTKSSTGPYVGPDFIYQAVRYIGGAPGAWPNAQVIAADFDGDGKTDLLVFRPSDGAFAKWYSDGSVGPDFNYQAVRYIGGAPGAWPNAQVIAADFDGDGKTDLLVFRPSDGAFAKWYSDGSVGPDFNYQAVRYIGGAPGAWPNAQVIAADFDGDGKTDLLVFPPSDGAFAKWYSDGSVGPDFNYQAVRYIGGAPGAWPNAQVIAADFDGDGKTDLLVFHPSDGAFAKWYSDAIPDPCLFRAVTVSTASRAAYALSGKFTQVFPDDPAKLSKFTRRGTTVFAQTAELKLAEAPITTNVDGASVELGAPMNGLSAPRRVAVSGKEGEEGPVLHEVAEVIQFEDLTVRTKLHLKVPLARSYVRESVTINANVALATHGETVREVLGGGDPTQPFQHLPLKQAPLTYIHARTPSGSQSTLEIRVNDLLWHEVSTLYGHGPDERIYVTERQEDNPPIAVFGDGVTGGRLPRAAENGSV